MDSVDQQIKKRSVTVYITAKRDTSLRDAAGKFRCEAIALLYSPNKCQMARFTDGMFFNCDSEEVSVDRVYEARIFNNLAEFRWLRDGEMGSASISSEHESIGFGETVSSSEYDVVLQRYLLWGQRIGRPKNGWTRFGSARIGHFDIPSEIETDRARLTAIEYLREDVDGNVVVAFERLTGIEAYQLEDSTANGE